MPNVEDLKPSGNRLGALNIDGSRQNEPAITDTRLDKANRVSAKLDVMLLKAAKTVAKPVDAEALKETTAGLPKATRKAIDKAAAQAKLSEQLRKAINAFPEDAPAAVRSALDEAVFRNDRRASEIQALVCEFADMAERVGNDPGIDARLDKTLASLVPAQSIKMHDSEKIAADFRISLAPLARRIEDLATGKERQLSGGETASIRRLLYEAAIAFVDNPTAENKTKMDALAIDIAGLGKQVGDELNNLANGASKAGYDLGELTNQQLQILVGDLPGRDQYRCPPRLVMEFRRALVSFMATRGQTSKLMKIAYGGNRGIATQTAHLVEMRKNVDRRDALQFPTGKTLDAAFEGRLAVTTLVETRLNGLPDEDADPALDGSNAVSSKALGSGAVNTVFEVKFKDDSTYASSRRLSDARRSCRSSSRRAPTRTNCSWRSSTWPRNAPPTPSA